MPSSTPEPPPQTVAGAGFSAFKFFAGLTNEKMLLLVLIAAFGFTMLTTIQSNAGRETYQMRMHEDARERDRRHCDEREDKLRAWQSAEREKDRQWGAQENDKNRAMLKDIVKAQVSAP